MEIKRHIVTFSNISSISRHVGRAIILIVTLLIAFEAGDLQNGTSSTGFSRGHGHGIVSRLHGSWSLNADSGS
jgi:hypothetical protein